MVTFNPCGELKKKQFARMKKNTDSDSHVLGKSKETDRKVWLLYVFELSIMSK